jgi:adenine-specific DNA methylase
MIEKLFDVPFVASMALQEKQIQQNYRPIIAVHKWFARRPGTLFRALMLSEYVEAPLRESYFQAHSLGDLLVADPFMGGGTPVIEANRLGCGVVACDINPMSYWIVREEVESLDLEAYRRSATALCSALEQEIGELYRTRCAFCSSLDASVKYFLWVKCLPCTGCDRSLDLLPGLLVARNQRHPANVFVCWRCLQLRESESSCRPTTCPHCSASLTAFSPARQNSCRCPQCGQHNSYPRPQAGPPQHRLLALEYHCRSCRSRHKGRFFKAPDSEDLAKYAAAEVRLAAIPPQFIPQDEIPSGDETDRLHRWGYRYYRDLFNSRQLLGLELSCRAISEVADARVQRALATNLSDLVRYQNMICRYDSAALKSLDVFSVHGYPVSLIQCESNLLGIFEEKRGVSVGSGGWSNIIEKYFKAKDYCREPFEIQQTGRGNRRIVIKGEWIGQRQNGKPGKEVNLLCESAAKAAELSAKPLDGVFTDPPYLGNVQYAELMDFCYVWLRRLAGGQLAAFQNPSTRHPDELTANSTQARGLDHFAQGLSNVFVHTASSLRPGRPFVFTYHHNRLEAYYPIAVALLDAGLVCTASLPCPAEMGGSIHINGTGSSIVDTIFVCRSHGTIQRRLLADSAEQVAELLSFDIDQLRVAGFAPTRGDIRCLLMGHLVRLAVWRLRASWDQTAATSAKLERMRQELARQDLAMDKVESLLKDELSRAATCQRWVAKEPEPLYGSGEGHEITF